MKVIYRDLVDAVECNNVELLLEYHLCLSNLVILERTGKTLLHIASEAGSVQIVEYLLNQDGVEVDVFNDANKTPLYYSIMSNHPEVTHVLIYAGADPNLLVDGISLLHLAIKMNFANQVRVLIESPKLDWTLKYPEMNMCYLGLLTYSFMINQDDLIIEFINRTSEQDFYLVLFRLIRYNRPRQARILIECGIINNFDYQDSSGRTALYLACRKIEPSVVRSLLAHGASNLKTPNGENLFYYIKCHWSPRTQTDIVPILLEYYPNLIIDQSRNHHNNNSRSLLCYAIKYHNWELVFRLIRYDQEYNELVQMYSDFPTVIDPQQFYVSDLSFKYLIDQKCHICEEQTIKRLLKTPPIEVNQFQQILECIPSESFVNSIRNEQLGKLFKEYNSLELIDIMHDQLDLNFSNLTWRDCLKWRHRKVAQLFAIKYLNIRNQVDLIHGDPIDQIDPDCFWISQGEVAWDLGDLKNYVIHITKGINRYDSQLPIVGGEKIWKSDDLHDLSKYKEGKLLTDYLAIGHLVNQLTSQQIQIIDETASIFWAKGPIWESTIKKVLNKDEFQIWNSHKQYRTSQEMPHLPDSISSKLTALKQEALFKYTYEYASYSEETKDAISKISNGYLDQDHLEAVIIGESCIMCFGERMWIFVEKVKQFHHSERERRRPRQRSRSITYQNCSINGIHRISRPRRNSLSL